MKREAQYGKIFLKIRQTLFKWNPNKILRTTGIHRRSSANCAQPNRIAALPVDLFWAPLLFPLPLSRLSDDQEFNVGIRDQTQQYPNKVTTHRLSLVHTWTPEYLRGIPYKILAYKTGDIRINGNIKARPRNHCCLGKEVNITYSEYVFVALGIQHANRMRHI